MNHIESRTQPATGDQLVVITTPDGMSSREVGHREATREALFFRMLGYTVTMFRWNGHQWTFASELSPA